jgi:hypothetical protein
VSDAESRDHGREYELTVEGVVGPALRASFPAHRFVTQERCTLLVVDDAHGREVDDLLLLLENAHLTIREIRRVRGRSP